MTYNFDADITTIANELGLSDLTKAYRNTDASEVSIFDTKAVDGKMRISGYASTITSDLSDEIVLPNSFDKHLWRYKKNPVICFQHNRDQVVGKALNVEIVPDKGLWMDIELAPTQFVKEYLWVLLEGEYIRQMSIGFLSLNGYREGKNYVHDETYLLENSIVTVACNPDAEIGVRKALAEIKSIEDFEKHKDVFQEILNKKHYNLNQGTMLPITKENTAMSNKPGIYATELATEYTLQDATIAITDAQLNKETKETLYLAKKVDEDGTEKYLWSIGGLTEKGKPSINKEKLQCSVAYALGAKGNILSKTEKVDVVKNIIKLYNLCGYTLPTVGVKCEMSNETVQLPIDTITQDVLEELTYHKMTFNEGEDIAITKKVVEDSFKAINSIASRDEYKSNTEIREAVSKFLIATFEVWGWIETPDDAEKVSALLNILVAQEEGGEDDTPSAYGEEPVEMAIGEDEEIVMIITD
jgi:HK97 family phage prohead protease